jgi:hypothetical protein
MAHRGSLGYALVGVIVGLLAAVGVLSFVGRGAPTEPPAPAIGRLLPEADGPLAEVVLHWTPEMDLVTADTYADFLRAISADVRVTLVVAKEASADDRARLAARLAAIDPSGALARRARTVETAGPITTWSKDRALVAAPRGPDEAAWLIAPLEPRRDWVKRHHDWGTVAALAAASEGSFTAHVAPFDFDAGDFVIDDRGRVIVDANLLEKNRRHGYASVSELRDALGRWFRAPVQVLGAEPGDTPRHHLAMYMTPLQHGVVLVGDPAAARDLVGADFAPGEVSVETEEPLRADFRSETVARFERVARDLGARGYRVERIPNVPFDAKTYLSYTNAVFETRGGERIVYLPVYDVPALDARATEIYERLGWTVRPIRVRGVYRHHGTIGCLVNVLARGPTPRPALGS